MNYPRLRVAAIWAISAWPALNFVMLNMYEIGRRGARSCLGLTAFTLGLGALGHALHWFANRRGRGHVVVTAWVALVILLFGFSLLGQRLDLLHDASGFRLPLAAVWAFLFVLSIGSILLSRHRDKLHLAAAMFCLVVFAVTSIMCLKQWWHFEPPRYDAAATPDAVADKPARLPGLNVYYILLDAYAGRYGIEAATGFDNAGFYARMAQRGFTDQSTDRSNYLQTIKTLGGIFALDYPLTDNPVSWRNLGALYPDVFERDVPPPLVRRLNEAGYFVWHSAAVWGGCAHRHVRCLGSTVSIEQDYLTQMFLAPTPFGRPRLELLAQQQEFLSITSRLPSLLASERPYFIFAHHMGPHPPFVVDADCNPRPVRRGKDWNAWLDSERRNYLDAVKCVNAQVERLVDNIVRQNPNALIVLQSDHGSAFDVDWEAPMSKWPQRAIRERSSFLNLVRAPKDCRKWLDRPLGQINTARFVLACVEGSAPAYLAEHTYLATYSEGAEKGILMRAPDR